MPFGYANCPPETRAQLERLTAVLVETLAGNLEGLYLHGSLALGCFNPRHSDLDLLALTRRRMDSATRLRLARTLSPPVNDPHPVEISLVPRSGLRPWRHPTPFDFHYSPDWQERFDHLLAAGRLPFAQAPMPRAGDLAGHLTVARARGIALYGPPPQSALPPVPWSDYLASILADFDWGRERLAQHPVYFTLNACRILAAKEEGRVLSKQEGGEWALNRLPKAFQPLVRLALDEYAGTLPSGSLSSPALPAFAEWMAAEIHTQKDSQKTRSRKEELRF
jgi:streptomycin 3"-adenylyltransferase